jgi:hypothetical protein
MLKGGKEVVLEELKAGRARQIFIALVGLSAAVWSWSEVTWGQVCPEGPPRCLYNSIQKALDAGLSEVLIAPGNYTELVTIRHSVKLQGLDRDKVILTGMIRTEGEGFSVEISGMTIRGWGWFPEGIMLRRVRAMVRDVVITQLKGFHAGIWVDDPSGDVLIERVEIKDNDMPDPFLKLRVENRESGIGGIVLSRLRPGQTIVLRENKIINNGFYKCEPRRGQRAGECYWGDGVVIGLVLEGLPKVLFEENVIRNNKGFGVSFFQPPCYPIQGIVQVYIGGSANEVRDNALGNLCPASFPWPAGFLKG